MLCLPGIAVAGANPFNGQQPAAPAGKKVEGAFKREELPPCDASGRDKYGGTDCKVVEPIALPRDGVTDEILEKYRLKR
jgi:hypothetical protein